MTTPQVGDRVRITYEGEVTGAQPDVVHVQTDGRSSFRAVCNLDVATRVEVLEKALPPEPALGSVVVNRHGVPAIRRRGGWQLLAVEVESFRAPWKHVVNVWGLRERDWLIYDGATKQ